MLPSPKTSTFSCSGLFEGCSGVSVDLDVKGLISFFDCEAETRRVTKVKARNRSPSERGSPHVSPQETRITQHIMHRGGSPSATNEDRLSNRVKGCSLGTVRASPASRAPKNWRASPGHCPPTSPARTTGAAIKCQIWVYPLCSATCFGFVGFRLGLTGLRFFCGEATWRHMWGVAGRTFGKSFDIYNVYIHKVFRLLGGKFSSKKICKLTFFLGSFFIQVTIYQAGGVRKRCLFLERKV